MWIIHTKYYSTPLGEKEKKLTKNEGHTKVTVDSIIG
jgi:hypothetical protein